MIGEEQGVQTGNLIGGERRQAASGRTFESPNPARHAEVIGVFPQSSAADVDAAVAAAQRALRDWRSTPWPRRGEIILTAATIMERRKEELARLMTREMGKVLTEARGDVQEAIDMGKFIAGEGRRFYGKTMPSAVPELVSSRTSQSCATRCIQVPVSETSCPDAYRR